MAYIGMRQPMAAPISSHTDGSAITYGTGMVLGPAVAANLTFDVADNPDYGDDIVVDNDNGINGYSGTIETNNLVEGALDALLGWEKTGTTDATYTVTDEAAPYVGFGFIRVKMFRGTRSYEGFWFHKAQFGMNAINAATKARQIEWNHPQLNVTGIGAYIDSSGSAKYFDFKIFDTETEALTWLREKANISSNG